MADVLSLDSASFTDGQPGSTGSFWSMSESFDLVVAPSASISGCTVDSGLVTSTTQFRSSPNSLSRPSAVSGYKFATFNAVDGNGGDIKAVVNFYLRNNQRDNAAGLFVRASANPASLSGTMYAVEVLDEQFTGSDWEIRLYKVVSGVQSPLASIVSINSGFPENGWYQLQLTANGSSLSVTLVRQSDGYYLNASGVFGSPVVNCLTATDSAISGSGYYGCYAWGQGTQGSIVYLDDFSAQNSAFSATPSTPEYVIPITVSTDQFAGSEFAKYTASVLTTDQAASLAEWTFKAVTVLSWDQGSSLDREDTVASIFARETPTEAEVAATSRTVCSLDGGSSLDCSSASITIVSLDFGTTSSAEWTEFASGLTYRIYANDGLGGAINYTTPIHTTSGLSWTTGALAYAGDWKFGVRVYDAGTTLEEKNIDAAVEIVLDASGNDISRQPKAPIGLRAIGSKGGVVRLEWQYPVGRDVATTGFKVYIGTTGTPDYSTPVATVPFAFGYPRYDHSLGALIDGTTYTIGVRAYNPIAEEKNTNTVEITADATGPEAVQSLISGMI